MPATGTPRPRRLCCVVTAGLLARGSSPCIGPSRGNRPSDRKNRCERLAAYSCGDSSGFVRGGPSRRTHRIPSWLPILRKEDRNDRLFIARAPGCCQSFRLIGRTADPAKGFRFMAASPFCPRSCAAGLMSLRAFNATVPAPAARGSASARRSTPCRRRRRRLPPDGRRKRGPCRGRGRQARWQSRARRNRAHLSGS